MGAPSLSHGPCREVLSRQFELRGWSTSLQEMPVGLLWVSFLPRVSGSCSLAFGVESWCPGLPGRQGSAALLCVSDSAGNEYDLSGLSRARKPWTAVDTFDEGKKRTFYLSVCTPLPYIPGCHGACQAPHSRSPCLPPLPATFNAVSRPLQAPLWGRAW